MAKACVVLCLIFGFCSAQGSDPCDSSGSGCVTSTDVTTSETDTTITITSTTTTITTITTTTVTTITKTSVTNTNVRTQAPTQPATTLAPATTAKPQTTRSLTSCVGIADVSICQASDCFMGTCSSEVCVASSSPLPQGTPCNDGLGECTALGECAALPTVTSCVGVENTRPCAAAPCETGACFSGECRVAPKDVGDSCQDDSGNEGTCSVLRTSLVCIPISTESPGYLSECTAETEGSSCIASACLVGFCSRQECLGILLAPDDTKCYFRPNTSEAVCVGGICSDNITTPASGITKVLNPAATDDVQGINLYRTVKVTVNVKLQGISPNQLRRAQVQTDFQTGIALAVFQVLKRTVEVVIIGINPDTTAPSQVDFVVIKLDSTVIEKNAIESVMNDKDALMASLKSLQTLQQSTVVWASVVDSSIVSLTATLPATTSTTEKQESSSSSDENGTEDAVVILACTAVFLIIGFAVIIYRYTRTSSNSFDVSGGGMDLALYSSPMKKSSNALRQKRGLNLTREKAPSSDNFLIARMPMNKDKNRSMDHLPYDTLRIKLYGPEHNDYINASMISGFNNKRTYIATQGPLKETASDFWQMVCEKNASAIVMMCRLDEGGKEQSFQYWTDIIGDKKSFGDIEVTTQSKKEMSNIDAVVRKFRVEVSKSPEKVDPEFAGKRFEIIHFQFLGFSETVTPKDPSSFLAFRGEVNKQVSSSQDEPIVVHCNNGCARTGVFVAFDREMQRWDGDEQVDIFQSVVDLRRERPLMLEFKAQFVFLHRVFLYYFLNKRNEVLGDHSEEQRKYLEGVTSSPTLGNFDVGKSGRKLLSCGKLKLLRNTIPTEVYLAIFTDIVTVAEIQEAEKFATIILGPRDEIKAKSAERALGPSAFKAKIGISDCAFQAETPEDKTKWMERLGNMDGFKDTREMEGPRLIKWSPLSRRAVLEVLNCEDPQTSEGANTLKMEFTTIPLVFNKGDRIVDTRPVQPPSSVGTGTPRRMYSDEVPRMLLNNQFQTMAQTPLPSSANPSVQYYDNESTRNKQNQQQPLGYRTAASAQSMNFGNNSSETILAQKLSELEQAIEHAAKLEFIANGGSEEDFLAAAAAESMGPPPSMDQEYQPFPIIDPVVQQDLGYQTLYEPEVYDLESTMPTVNPLTPAQQGFNIYNPPTPASAPTPYIQPATSGTPKRSAAAERIARGVVQQEPDQGFKIVGAARKRMGMRSNEQPPPTPQAQPLATAAEPQPQPQANNTQCTFLGNCTCPDCR
eukprot:m.339416 g.339416  ORF g.339416 m.339416 type:complete len:1256 (+) comp18794_c0_seq1:311-4078(+)